MNQKNIFLLEEVVRKNFSAKYKDSILGIVWSVLNPLLMVIVLTIVFSTLLGRGIENYPVYLFSGRCILTFFTAAIGGSMSIFKSNQNILKKTAAPKYIFVLGNIISEFLNFIISLILLIAIMIVTNAPIHFLTIPFSIIPLTILIIMITGFNLIMAVVSVYYTDIKHLWGVISQILFYTSAIFYRMDDIPEPYHQYLILNPIYWIIEQFRDFMVNGTFPNLFNIVNSLILSLIILVIGIIIFKKFENGIIMRI